MRLIATESIDDTLRLAAHMLDPNGQVLLQRGTRLDARYAATLRKRGYPYVWVHHASSPYDALPEEDLAPSVRTKVIHALRRVFAEVERCADLAAGQSTAQMVELCRSKRMRALSGPNGLLAALRTAAGDLVADLAGKQLLSGVAVIVPEEIQLYQHHIGTATASVVLGHKLGLPDEEVRELALGALLHDIGTAFVAGQPNANQRVRDHTVLGYEIIRNYAESPLIAAQCALDHHERQDGTGLPRRLPGQNKVNRNVPQDPRSLSLYGEIVAIANAYDNMLNGRGNHVAPMPASEVVQVLRKGAGTAYNQELVQILCRLIPPYPCGTDVRIASGKWTGFEGVVEDVPVRRPDRPQVIVYRDPDGTVVPAQQIDLEDLPDCTVEPL